MGIQTFVGYSEESTGALCSIPVKAASYARLNLANRRRRVRRLMEKKLLCLIHVTGSYINGHWEKEIRARDRTARVTQIVMESR